MASKATAAICSSHSYIRYQLVGHFFINLFNGKLSYMYVPHVCLAYSMAGDIKSNKKVIKEKKTQYVGLEIGILFKNRLNW